MLRVLVFFACASSAYADFAPPRPTPAQKAAVAPLIFVGKIVDVEKDTVSAPAPYRSEGKQDFTMVSIKITEGLVGCTGLTQIRLGIAPLDLGPRRGSFPIEGLEAKKDYVACFFLTPHPHADFYIVYPWFHPLPATSPTFEKDLAEAKGVTKIVDDPVKALQAKELAERAKSVGLLLMRYNTYPIGNATPTQEAIGAAESKLILKTLRELDWNGKTGQNRAELWYQLRLTDQDGWNPGSIPPDKIATVMEAETAKWLDKNMDTFRVKKYVPSAKKK